VNCPSDVTWLEGTKRTLEGLLSHAPKGNSEENTASSDVESMQPGPPETDKMPNVFVKELDKTDLPVIEASPPLLAGREGGQRTDPSLENWEDLSTHSNASGPRDMTISLDNTSAREGSPNSAPNLIEAGCEGNAELTVGNAKSKSGNDDDDQIKWVQVGAVVGAAVVGGVALALRNQGDGGKTAEDRRRFLHHGGKKPHQHHHGKDDEWLSM